MSDVKVYRVVEVRSTRGTGAKDFPMRSVRHLYKLDVQESFGGPDESPVDPSGDRDLDQIAETDEHLDDFLRELNSIRGERLGIRDGGNPAPADAPVARAVEWDGWWQDDSLLLPGAWPHGR